MIAIQKKMGKSIRTKEGNYRIEKFTMDRHSQTGSVGIGCYVSNIGETSARLCIKLNRLFNLEKKRLALFDITKAMFICDIPDVLLLRSAFGEFIVQFNMPVQDVKLRNVEYKIIKDTIIKVLDKSNIVILDK